LADGAARGGGGISAPACHSGSQQTAPARPGGGTPSDRFRLQPAQARGNQALADRQRSRHGSGPGADPPVSQAHADLPRRLAGRRPDGRGVGAEDAEVLARIAEDYYVAGRNQQQIADDLKVSRSYVSRLLDRARTTGIVRITVNHPV